MRALLFATVFGLGLSACAGPPAARHFQVSAVAAAAKPLATRPAEGYLRQLAGADFEAGGKLQGKDMVDMGHVAEDIAQLPHPFVQAVHLSFAQHRSLVLSPDMVWLLMCQTASRHVLANPEAARRVLVRHAGTQLLSVRRDGFRQGDAGNDWPGVFAEFERGVAAGSPTPDLIKGFAHPFTSSTPDMLAARQVTLLKTVSPYYRFNAMTGCGTPEIILEGTSADWRWIRRHAEDWKTLGMEGHLVTWRPVLDQFVAASEGKVDAPFWESMYKYNRASGGDQITGWIQVFLTDDAKQLAKIAKPDFSWQHKRERIRTNPDGSWIMYEPPALTLTDIPRGNVTQGFTWEYLNNNLPMALHAGFVGVSQDAANQALRPEISWLVRRASRPLDKVAFDEFVEGIRYLGQGEIFQLQQMWAESEGKKGALGNNSRFLAEVIPHLTHLERLDDAGWLWRGDLLTEAEARLLMALPNLRHLQLGKKSVTRKIEALLCSRKDWELVWDSRYERFPSDEEEEEMEQNKR